ncbi:hypothetical protein [Siccibacter turicensis]
MAIAVYLWLYEEEGKLLKGSVEIIGRDGKLIETGYGNIQNAR